MDTSIDLKPVICLRGGRDGDLSRLCLCMKEKGKDGKAENVGPRLKNRQEIKSYKRMACNITLKGMKYMTILNVPTWQRKWNMAPDIWKKSTRKRLSSKDMNGMFY